jgi:RNA polymerase sigma-70 factor (ECF subfamily)
MAAAHPGIEVYPHAENAVIIGPMGSLGQALASNAPPETAAALAALEDLEAQAAALFERARTASTSIDASSFLAWVGRRLDVEDVLTLDRLEAEDLALAHACASGDARSIAQFYERHADLMMRIVRRVAGDSRADDVMQAISAKLFVAGPHGPPRIERYTGRGNLGAWVRVVATREALTAIKNAWREQPVDMDQIAAEIAAEGDPELLLIKQTYAREFARAFGEALAALSPRQRNVLRYSAIEGLSIDEIGALYGVHRATAARWLERAREDLHDDTRARLTERLALDPSGLSSLLRFIRSAVDISLGTALAETAEEPD